MIGIVVTLQANTLMKLMDDETYALTEHSKPSDHTTSESVEGVIFLWPDWKATDSSTLCLEEDYNGSP